MEVRTRFAPSPTGYLHIGNVRTALVNWLFTRKHGGKFLLRMDDTDLQRSKKEFEEAIINDLKWLGLNWDDFARQSERSQRYEEIKQKLIKDGRLYPCFETSEEIEVKRKIQLSRGQPPIYDRAALKLTTEQIEKLISEGKKPHYRFKMNPTPVSWLDMVKGELSFHGSNISDPVVIREDGSMTYILCSVIDDIDFKITHIIRGEDHVSNTAVQIQIFEALNSKPPIFGHTALIKNKEGEISKRLGGFDIATLRKETVMPMSINSMFSTIGTSDPIEPKKNLNELTNNFDISKFGRSPANYDKQELIELNHKLIGLINFEEAKPFLQEANLNVEEYFFNAVKGNIKLFNELEEWHNVCYGAIKPILGNEKLITAAIKLLPQEPWDESTWQTWTKTIQAETGLKGKELFMPLRLALTGLKHGPELKYMLKIIGHKKVLSRLQGNEA